MRSHPRQPDGWNAEGKKGRRRLQVETNVGQGCHYQQSLGDPGGQPVRTFYFGQEDPHQLWPHHEVADLTGNSYWMTRRDIIVLIGAWRA